MAGECAAAARAEAPRLGEAAAALGPPQERRLRRLRQACAALALLGALAALAGDAARQGCVAREREAERVQRLFCAGELNATAAGSVVPGRPLRAGSTARGARPRFRAGQRASGPPRASRPAWTRY